MTIHYVDTSQGSDGTGTLINPYNTLASVNTVAGDTVLIKTGTTLVPIPARNHFFPLNLISKDNITLGEYGTGAKPVFDGSVIKTEGDFTFDAGNGVYYLQFTADVNGVVNRMGNIAEEGTKLKHYSFTTNIATTAALMVNGQYTVDFTTNRLYIKPVTGSISGKTYSVSNILSGIREDTITLTTGLSIQNLAFTRASRHGGVLYNKTDFIFDGVDFDYIGGFADSASVQVGNGLELSYGCQRGEVINGVASNIFDSGYTCQTYETSRATVNDIEFRNLAISKCGLAGIELSCPNTTSNTFQSTKNITFKDSTISDIAPNSSGASRWDYNWSGYRGGYAINLTNNGGTSNIIDGCLARNVIVTNAFRMAQTKDTYGINRFLDITGFNITDTNIVGSTATDGQAHQYYNVTDGVRSPAGVGKWTESSGIALPVRSVLTY